MAAVPAFGLAEADVADQQAVHRCAALAVPGRICVLSTGHTWQRSKTTTAVPPGLYRA